ncbi:sigma 54-interacting transcriptional regulator [Immundisolibacter sp.]|uniref:sigma 54-interacting transcriptional regulator n=1 Tax=Immundisolibacter sp. TaxID=1934948 RepID=UPI0035667C00
MDAPEIRPAPSASSANLTYLWQGDTRGFPDVEDLVGRLRFAPSEGRIWLDDQRSILMRGSAFGSLRRELLESIGFTRARAVLKRVGYAEGTRDADLARRVRPEGNMFDAFAVGPQVHALSGFGWLEVVELRFDPATDGFYGEFLLRDSVEADAHLKTLGVSAEAVCWTAIGYGSGYSSAFAGRPIIVDEVECRAMGHAHCKLVGRPVEEWDRRIRKAAYFRPQEFVNRFGKPSESADTDAPAAPTGPAVDVVGISAGFGAAVHLLGKAAPTDVTVLFLGETGVGKEVFARMLHRMGPRAEHPFIAVNCAALPENLIEAELFGVVKGAYTGASDSRPGRFERASGGTLFLDEIGTLTLSAQAKLLRALQEGEIERVGDSQTRKVDVRLLAATNVDLKTAVTDGTFREDLYYRLTTFPVRIPPLRERRDDIPLLMRHFLHRFSERHHKKVGGFAPQAVEALLSFDFPGNIRELENMIERAVLLADDGEPISLSHLFSSSQGALPATFGVDAHGQLASHQGSMPDPDETLRERLAPLLQSTGTSALEAAEQTLIELALEQADGNLAQAARQLGISRRQLAYRLDKRSAAQEQDQAHSDR